MTDWIVGSSILIVMIFAIRKVFGMRISSRFRYALWAVVMIRLLCPVTLWNNQQLVHNITEVSSQMFQNTSELKWTRWIQMQNSEWKMDRMQV